MCRAATPETRAHVPYNIVLVDAAEGFRMMAHGDNDLAIGDKVTAQLSAVCGKAGSVFREDEVNVRHQCSRYEATQNYAEQVKI